MCPGRWASSGHGQCQRSWVSLGAPVLPDGWASLLPPPSSLTSEGPRSGSSDHAHPAGFWAWSSARSRRRGDDPPSSSPPSSPPIVTPECLVFQGFLHGGDDGDDDFHTLTPEMGSGRRRRLVPTPTPKRDREG